MLSDEEETMLTILSETLLPVQIQPQAPWRPYPARSEMFTEHV